MLGEQMLEMSSENADYLHMWWECKGMSDFGEKFGLALSHISSIEVPKNPQFMVLMDFAYFKIPSSRMLFANLLTAASLFIVKVWKSIDEWVNKIRYLCLINKLSVLNSHRNVVSHAITRYTT